MEKALPSGSRRQRWLEEGAAAKGFVPSVSRRAIDKVFTVCQIKAFGK
jgi:hypothetical protein